MAREQVKRKKAPEAAQLPRGALIAKSGARVPYDPWVVLNDIDGAPEGADVVVTLSRFKGEREELLGRNSGRLGIVLQPDEAVEDIGADAERFGLVMVHFPAFRDGRGFTTARLLRERFGYKGELRATGDVLEDQIFYMLRCGFDTFELVSNDPEAAFARAAGTFTNAYQATVDGMIPVHRKRAQRRAVKAAS